jgi:Ser/Thr protein kinase RdoA (MazF antagonist)
MRPKRFTKGYETPQACAAARFHHQWLSAYARPLHLPRLLFVGSRHLQLEYVSGRHAVPADLEALAGHLGDAHGAAWVAALHAARLDTPYRYGGAGVIADFLRPRLAALDRGKDLRDTLGADGTERIIGLLRDHAKGPVAFYKDTNPRNILVTPTCRFVTVDVDDLTLAPFGYDLAKLLVALAMTHGLLSKDTLERALAAYNTAAARHVLELGCTTLVQLLDFAEIHHVLTAPYLGRGGYRYLWPAVRPHVD